MADNVIQIIIRAKDEAAKALNSVARELGFVSSQSAVVTSGIDGATRAMSAFAPSLSGVINKAGDLARTLAEASLPVAPLVDALAGVSGLGVATEASLSRMQVAAQDGGVALDKLASSATIFSAVLAASEKGVGSGVKALESLGFTASEIGGGLRASGNAFALVSERLAGVKDKAEQARLATALFGDAGTDLIPVLGGIGGSAGGASSALVALLPAIAGATAGLVGLVVVLGAVNRTLAAAREGGEFADRLGDIAERTGLTVEAVSRLGFVASQTDTSLEALTGSFRFLSRNLIEARDQSSETRDLLLALGFTAQELDGGLVNAREAMLRLADAFQRTNDPILRSAISTKLLGRSAEELIPFLGKGSAGILALERDADTLNTTITKAAAAAGDAYTKALDRAQLASLALKSDIGTALLPTLTDLIDALTRATGTMRDFVAGAGELGRVFAILSGVSPGKIGEFFTSLPDLIRLSIPPLNDLLRLIELVAAFAPKNQFSDVTTGGTNSAEEDVLAHAARLKAEREAREKAKEAAAAQAIELAKLRVAFDAAADAAYKLSRAEAEVFFAADPKTAAAAVAALQKIIEGMDALPVGVTADRAELLSSIEQAIDGLRLQIAVEIDPATRAGLERDLEQLEAKARRVRGGTREATGQAAPPPLSIEGQAGVELPQGALVFGESAEKLALVNDRLEQAGINVEALTDALVAARATMESMVGTVITLGEGIRAAFEVSFDPLLQGLADIQSAVFDFGQSINKNVDQTLRSFIFEGQKGFKSLEDGLRRVGLAIKALAQELLIAIIRTVILKALSGGLFSGGGTVTRGVDSGASGAGNIAAGGGRIVGSRRESAFPGTARFVQALAAGGAAVALASAPVSFAGGGSGLVPGAISNRDSVFAHLAPGEYVLTNRGGMNPTRVVERLASLGERLETGGRRAAEVAGADSPVIGQLVINAPDWESWRNQSRPGGRLAEELTRQLELGR